MTALATPPKLQFLDANGAPLVGGKLYTYAAGTTTPLATYTDYGGGTANANPVILDSRGEASVWLGSALYKMALYSATDVLIWTVDNIGGFATLAQLAASGGSNLVGFLQAGTGAVATTVQAKLRESVSVLDFGVNTTPGTTDMTAAWGNWLSAAGPKVIPADSYLVSGVVKKYTTPTFVNTADTNHAAGLYALEKTTTGNGNTAFGNSASAAVTTGSQNTAVGKSALETMVAGNNNTAIGFSALRYANDAGAIQNTCVGSIAGGAITTGANNTATGHNCLFTLTTGDFNSATGQGALAYNVTGDYNCGFGYHSLLNYTGSNGCAYGVESLQALTTGTNNTAFGFGALKSVVTAASNTAFGFSAGQVITSAQNTCMGDSALFATTTGAANTAYGYNALVANQTGANNTAIGAQTLISNVSGSRNVSLGRVTLISATGDDNTAVGTTALNACTTGIANTALGGQALIALTTFDNCTGLGFNSAVTGSNQVQLGDSSTTTYAYGAVQNRSDNRDKADVRPTILGLDFINSLRPVDFKWDLREDYFVEEEVDTGLFDEFGNSIFKIVRTRVEKDGSKKRSRFHHGLIAQEVKAACDAAGVDFGGYQDHSLKGGEDVLSLGYEELIAPLIKAVQQLSAEVVELKSK